MEYKLNNYNRNITEEKLISDLLSVAKKLGTTYISRNEYEHNGLYSATPYLRKYGTWINALKAAKLNTKRPQNDYLRISDNALVDDMRLVAEQLKQKSITTTDYKQYGKYKVQTIITRFESWNHALEQAGLNGTGYHRITDNELFEEIERLWVKKGSQPTTTDIKNGMSLYSLNTYSRHFGGWRSALNAFLQWINSEKEIDDETSKKEKKSNNKTSTHKHSNIENDRTPQKKHSTSRDVNLRLRFLVLQRDNFKCCKCGASPATNPDIVLHVDHKKPWSKGGETVMDNLQTLCSKCNLGKSDLDIS